MPCQRQAPLSSCRVASESYQSHDKSADGWVPDNAFQPGGPLPGLCSDRPPSPTWGHRPERTSRWRPCLPPPDKVQRSISHEVVGNVRGHVAVTGWVSAYACEAGSGLRFLTMRFSLTAS
ncbi:hypothetical protein GQ53DRAFT_95362 [Thozetella sp. PMI_491]|nr:hypothetical protein GQ53DRAFT_95362 [Thozetella sp. PMI_491]